VSLTAMTGEAQVVEPIHAASALPEATAGVAEGMPESQP
jgi:hypothetical protein